MNNNNNVNSKTDICSTAVLVVLSISQWTRARKDDAGARAAEMALGATRAGKYVKFLVPKQATAAIASIATAMREAHYRATVAWADGQRLLPIVGLDAYRQVFSDNRHGFWDAVDAFLVDSEYHRGLAEQQLGSMFDVGQFPGRDELRSKFDMKLEVLPVPTDDFRVNIGAVEREALTAAARTSIEYRLAASLRDTQSRLLSVATHVAERLGDPDAVFRDSLVERSRELVSEIAQINIYGDPTIEQACAALTKCLESDPQDVREQQPLREAMARQAVEVQQILRMVGAQ